MKRTVNKSQFCEAFKEANRGNNFRYEGLKAIFFYLEDYEQDSGKELELDVIAICCDFSEYENLAAFQNDYSTYYETIDDIRGATTVIDIDLYTDDDGKEDGSFIIQAF